MSDPQLFRGQMVAQVGADISDGVASFGQETHLKVEVVPHVVEPAVINVYFRSDTSLFYSVGVHTERIVTGGMHDDRGQPDTAHPARESSPAAAPTSARCATRPR